MPPPMAGSQWPEEGLAVTEGSGVEGWVIGEI
jgi:hypothetical protein